MAQLSGFERWWLDAWPHRLHIRQYMPAFLKSCPDPFRGEVLEVGAGGGWSSRRILETFPQVELTATDIDEEALTSFKRLQEVYGKRLRIKQADLLNLPFDRASFDIVVAFHVLHHVADVQQAIRQFMRVLRPGGLLGIADEDQRYVVGPLRWLWRSANRLSRDDVIKILQEEGEVIVSEGEVHYTVWVRKAYPIQPAVSATEQI